MTVDARHGFARLRKVPARTQQYRGASTSRSTPRPFTRRRYCLFAVTAAVLSDTPRPQISLQDLVERIRAITAETEGISPFDPTHRDERLALIDAVAQLVTLGVLAVVDTHGDYVESVAANVLYDIDDRRLGHLIAAPHPPSLAISLAHMLHEDRYGPWIDPERIAPEDDDTFAAPAAAVRSIVRARALAVSGAPGVSDEQHRRRARHRIMRMLLDDPVLYLDRLEPSERSYLQQTISSLAQWTAEAGMELERRAEGWALIDPDSHATDLRFPEGDDLVKFAGLLLLGALQPADTPHGPVRHPLRAAERVLADRLRANPTWARGYQDDGGANRMTKAALDLLAGLDMVAVDSTGCTMLPAAGRYRPNVADPAPAVAADGAADSSPLDDALFPEGT